MGMGCTRVVERVCAATGALSEASTRFDAALDVPNGGLLWSLPALLENGLLRHSREFFSLPKGFYSLVQIFVLLGFMALARIKTVEQLRFNRPGELGNLLGLDRVPEVRTLREKMKILAHRDSVSGWSKRLSREWMEGDREAAGILYVDGHVRAYHGRKARLPRRYVARERLCLRGTTDFWVNDAIGRPFFVVTTPLTSGLLEMLRQEIVPRLLRDVPGQPSAEELEGEPSRHRFMLVFDREGYSPAFFKEMLELHIACQTYNKYPKETWPQTEFTTHTVTMPHGEQIKMKLGERGLQLSNGLWVREIRKRGQSDHQTSVLSTDYLSEAEDIAVHMFSRWSQENFFKYMRQHFSIDRLSDYSVHPIDETSKVVNPAHRLLESRIKSKAGTLGRRWRDFGQLTLQEEPSPKEMAGYERKKGTLKEEIDLLSEEVSRLKEKRKKTPRHVTIADLPEEETFTQLTPTRKHFIDTIRMIAYRAETAMAILLRDVLARSDDARSFLRELFASEADLIPNIEMGTLTVRLHHMANHMSDEAVRFLSDNLNATETLYPGTNLRMIYKMVSD